MKTKTKVGRPKKTARIYYGPESDPKSLWWTVAVTDAKKPVKVNGNIADALAGIAGTTIGCHLSRCCKRNATAFGHPCLMAAFTKTTAYIVTRVKNGRPTHAIRYSHSYGALVELNDKDKQKKLLKTNPELAERDFVLRKPHKSKSRPQSKVVRPRGISTQEKLPFMPRGALKRAIDAGFVSAGLI